MGTDPPNYIFFKKDLKDYLILHGIIDKINIQKILFDPFFIDD